jgi:hypothetical protein
MGLTQSIISSYEFNAPSGFNYFTVMIGNTCTLELLFAPLEVINETKIILGSLWKIEKITEQQGLIQIQLKGAPFGPSSELDKSVKYFMCLILKKYYELGYHFQTSVDLQKTGGHSDAVIFEKREPISNYTICLSLNSTDIIRVLAPEEVINHVKNTIIQTWSSGIKHEERILNGLEFKLEGKPWDRSANSNGLDISSLMINALLQTLYNHSWVFIGSIKSSQSPTDLNSLYFRFDSNLLQSLKSGPKPSTIFSLTLEQHNRMRLINASKDLIAVVRTAINEAWPEGIKEEFNLIVGYEFKLKGNPWGCDGQDSVLSRRIVSNILRLMRQYNWSLYATSELSPRLFFKNAFFFRFDPTRLNNRPLCISLNGSNKIRVIDGTQDHINAVFYAIQNSWPEGFKEHSLHGLSYQFKLRGCQFRSFSNPRFAAAVVMLIISNLKTQGVNLLCSAQVNGKIEREDDDSLYLMDLSSLFFFF